MKKTSRYDVLFEPVKVGPVTAKNRFYQVPHCCGMGHLRPQAHAAMRGMKAEGGWSVVSTEEAEIHPSSDLSPYPEQRLWDEKDIPALQLMTDAVHSHGALAAIELVHNGFHSANLYSRIPALAPVDTSLSAVYPKQARAMSKADLRDLRRWHRLAARRAKEAGFDIVYVYAGHVMTLAQHFLLPQYNTRTDEYGGSLENRTRLIRELLEETLEEIGDRCAVAFRFAVDELKGVDGMQAHEEGRAVVEMLAELPDLWDVNVADWSNDSQTTRFQMEEGYQTEYIEFVKKVTSKPVVAVGRLSSPDLMVSLVNRGIVDFIGAARPSIADPFLPQKIENDRIEEIRECIGCNICVSCDNLGIPIRCTQNPTMGEEWRRGWHPQKIQSKTTDEQTLVVGAGPAGLECALQLARRGYDVSLAEASDQLGGRALSESKLKGLEAWLRVRDNRVYELQQMANVNIFMQSELSVNDILETEINNVFIATGSRWRNDGIGRSCRTQLPDRHLLPVFTPDDIMSGMSPPEVPIVIFDDDQCYLGGVLADHLSAAGHSIIFVTSASIVSPWTEYTLEQPRVQKTLIEQGVTIIANKIVSGISDDGSGVITECVFTGAKTVQACGALLLVTERLPHKTLHTKLLEAGSLQSSDGSKLNIELLGDALAPGLIADAIFSGHLVARDFQEDPQIAEQALFRRELPSLTDSSTQ